MAQRHIFEVEMPDGKILEVDAPVGTPQEQIRARAKKHWDTKQQAVRQAATPRFQTSEERGGAPGEMIEGAGTGWNESFDKLAEYLATA